MSAFAQETTEEMIARADKLFEAEQYVEATPLYLQALSLDPKVASLSFKYGACLLYNSGDKREAIRYLNYGAADPNCDVRAHYFRGRALHLDYQFDAAKKSYQTYLAKRDKFDKRYPVEREIEMCENGKHLLTSFTDIIVTQKKQIPEAKFYEIYSDSKTIGGQIIVNADYQSKIDKKKGHVPTVHISPNAKRIFYASYGDDESTGKDIYMRIKLPNEKWSEPQLAPGGVNTKEDEEYPFLHASGKYLYFSSKGHNSMGGYDVFMCRFDEETNSFGPAENVDFAISSPDDDLFYVVDSAYQNAYFASARSSEAGKLHVYKVKVARVPLQEVIVMGDFKSDLHPESQKVTIQLIKHSNGTELATMKADAAKGGKDSYVFPQGGKYDYIIDVDGSDAQYRFTVELPFLDEFRPLKQLILHTEEDGREIVRLINKFDENVEGAEAIIAEVIRKKSNLEVNEDQFDLEKIEASNETNEILAELGFESMSLDEVSNQLLEIASSLEENTELTARIQSNIASELVAKSDRVKELHQMEEELRNSALKTTDPLAKHKLITEASQKQQEKETLITQINDLEALLKEVDALANGGADTERLNEIQEKFNQLAENESEIEALQFLLTEKEQIDEAKTYQPQGIRNDLIKETTDIRAKLSSLSKQKNEFSQTIQNLESKIQLLEREREAAKKKDLERIDSEIAAAQQEKQFTEEALKGTVAQMSELEQRLNTVEDQLASFQNAMSTEQTSGVSMKEALEAGQEINQIAATETFNYTEELAQLEAEHPEINGGDPIQNWSEDLEQEHDQTADQINNNTALTELERTARLIENNVTTVRDIDAQLAKITDADPKGENDRLQAQKSELIALKNELLPETEALRTKERALKQETPDAALSKEDVLAEIVPNFEEKLQELDNNTNGNPRENAEQRVALQENLDQKITAEIAAVEAVLAEQPDNEEARARKELLTELQSENAVALNASRSALEELPPAKEPLSAAEVMTEIDADYEARKAAIAQSDQAVLDKEKAVLTENKSLKAKLDKEITSLEKELRKNPEDPTLNERKAAVEKAQAILEEEIAEHQQTIQALENASVASVTEAQVLEELLPTYNSEKQRIEQSNETPLDKAKQTLAVEIASEKELDREVRRLEKEAKKYPEDATISNRLEATKSALNQVQSSQATLREEIQGLENVTTPIILTTAELREELIPDFEEEVQKIGEGTTSSIETERKFKALNERLLEAVTRELEATETALNEDPENEALTARKKGLESLKNETIEAIQRKTEAIAALENQPEASVVTKESVIETLIPNYTEQIDAVDNSDAGPGERALRKARIEAGLLEQLKERQSIVEESVKDAPNDSAVQLELDAINEAIAATSESLEKHKREAVTLLSDEEKAIVLEGVAPDYLKAIENAGSREEELQAEEDLQAVLEAAMKENDKKLRRSYSVTVAIENQILTALIKESQERVQEMAIDAPSAEEAFIESIRITAGARVNDALLENESTKEGLAEQDRILAEYELLLDTKIEDVEAEIKDDPSAENQGKMNWLLQEKERVTKKRRSIKVSIGEIETTQIASTSEDPELQSLENEEQRIRTSLEKEDLTPSERKVLTTSLHRVEESQLARKNELLAATLTEETTSTSALKIALEDDRDQNTNSLVTVTTLEHAEKETAAIDGLKEAANNADSEAERNYLLTQAQQRTDRLKEELEETKAANQLRELEEMYEISTASEQELEQKRRRAFIEIGEVSREIERVETALETAKRKEIPELNEEKALLEARKAKLEADLERLEVQLKKQESTPEALDPKALEETISFNEERKLAATEEYKEYQEAATEALMVANEIRNLEEGLELQRNELQRMVRNGESDESLDLKARSIQTLEEEIDRKRIDLTQKKFNAEQALPEDEEEAMKMQNLVARGIQPLKVAAVAATIIQMPTSGFAIDTSASRPNNGAIEIPVGVKAPEGLVYRVQVGAFARPLRDDVFKEFNPVSGEKIEGTNITRYMAGYFNSSETVVDARAQIRNLGYSDAFIVAYCNGERITFGEARRLEEAGICVPKRTEEIMIEVAESTAENLNIPISNEVEEVPEWTYNQAPGAADADPIEKMEGLFFTVQVGVFNRPVSPEDLNNMPNLKTFRLPNGQIRYNSGIFDSAEEAVPRQNFARQSGIQGAFIVAYYKGERISIGNARRLLNENGKGILQSRMAIATPEQVAVTNRTDTVTTNVVEIVPMEEWEMRVQIVTEKTFDEFPRDVLNRYNAEGSFYFDSKDKKVKSVIYKNEEYLPNLRNFKDDIDTIYLEEGILDDEKTEALVMTFTDSLLPGDFMDWMLRCEFRRSMQRTYKGVEVKIFGIPEEEMETIIEQIKRFGVLPEQLLEIEEQE